MCENHKFVQLHLHTDASLLDGVSDYKKIIKKAKGYGHPAVAITDHGNPCRTYDFYVECKKQGIKPILGLEFYITFDHTSRLPHKERTFEDRDFHQSVYIKNKAGFLNYNYLTYKSFTDGFYYKPRIDFKLLFERKEGLMITSSCMASVIGNHVRENNHKEAEEMFKQYLYEFGDDFYGEIQFNEVPMQKDINDFIMHMCKKYKVKCIIGGDVHYTEPEDNVLQDAVIRSKRDAEAPDWIIDARKLYFHDTTDYFTFNKELGWNYDEKFIEECFANSVEFSEKVNFEFETGKYHLPKIDTKGKSSKDYIADAAWTGIAKLIETERKYFPNKYTNEDIEKLENQVQYELKVIDDMGLNDYLLIVHDIIKWEKENGYYVGPGRGCFLPDSKVIMNDGSKVSIQDIKIGDKVKNHFELETEVVKLWAYDVDEEMVELEFEDGRIIKCTKDHEIFTLNRGWIKADELTQQDEISEVNKKEDILNFIKHKLSFPDISSNFRHTDEELFKKEHFRFEMSGYDGDTVGSCTVSNQNLLNKFAYLGLYDFTEYLFLDFYKGTPTLYWKYWGEKKNREETFDGWKTSEIIYKIFELTIFSNKNKRRR